MGGLVSRRKRAAPDGKSPRKDVSADAKQELVERERQLALREKIIADRQVELEEWEARLKGRDGGARIDDAELVNADADQGGAVLAYADADEGGQPGGSSTRKSPTSLLLLSSPSPMLRAKVSMTINAGLP